MTMAVTESPVRKTRAPRKRTTQRSEPVIPDWTVPLRPPRIYERCVKQPDPSRDDMIVGEVIPLLVLKGVRPVAAAQQCCVFPLTLKTWIARGLEEVSAMTVEDRDDPAPTEAPYVWLTMGVMRAEAEWEAWAVEQWAGHFGKDWRAIQAMMKAKFPEFYSDTAKVELTGSNGGPVQVANIPTLDQVAALLAQDEAALVERARSHAVTVQEIA